MNQLPRLDPLPPSFVATVAALHEVAERVVAPARKPDNEISLRATEGGFGTPPFEFGGSRHQVRVEGEELIHSEGTAERRAPLSSLVAAAEAVAGLLPANAELSDRPLDIDPASSRALGAWYGFADALLGEIVAAASAAEEATPPRLWPEHFDIAIELGAEGGRANYGASPGDADHPEPYLYVGPWTAPVAGELWQASGFKGAELGYAELLDSADPGTVARDFFRTRKDALAEIARSEK